MSKPPSPPSLAELRKEIDAIDEGVHRLLMQRGDIIDRLIQVKQTQEVGSAFRPAREADMMRRLVERHRGILPIDTVESIWRVIISTFTYVQAPFSVHADVSVGESAMRDSPRSTRSRNRRATWRWSRRLRAARRGGASSRPTARQRSSRGCRSSSAPIIPPHSRCS
jgi:chorismate mutase